MQVLGGCAAIEPKLLDRAGGWCAALDHVQGECQVNHIVPAGPGP